MSTKPMSRGQRKLWWYLHRYRGAHGYPPPLPVIARFLETSKQATSTMLSRMEAAGHVHRAPSVGSWVEVEQ